MLAAVVQPPLSSLSGGHHQGNGLEEEEEEEEATAQGPQSAPPSTAGHAEGAPHILAAKVSESNPDTSDAGHAPHAALLL